MGRKIEMKKIEDVTKCQVTFSKRRSSLMKKAHELSVCCDVDVAFVAFSPSGRVTKFSNQKRIEDVLQRYVNLPPDMRLQDMNNVQGKMDKLKQLSHINGETSKLHFLDKQIENHELQIKKTGLELQILETGLRDYEINLEQEPSLHQLSWCERNLKHSLQRIITRKQVELESQPRNNALNPTFSNHNQQVSVIENLNLNPNSISAHILMQMDPAWITSPYSAKVGESIFQGIVDQAKKPINENVWQNQPIPTNYMSKAPIEESPPLYIPTQDQPLLNFQGGQNNYNNSYNASSVVFSDAIHMSTQSLCTSTVQDPRSGPTTSTKKIGGLQCINSNIISQFSNIGGSSQENGNNISKCDTTTIFFSANTNNTTAARNYTNNIVGCDRDFGTTNMAQIHRSNYQQQGPYYVVPHHKLEAAVQDAQSHNLLQEGREDNAIWSWNAKTSNTSHVWEWDDLLLDDNFNLQNLP